MKYRREVDGLRAVAVVPVILFHAGLGFIPGGFIGVDVFFVISGYLITSIILAELEVDKFSIIRFYERRARRILPALVLVMGSTIPFAWLWLSPSHMKDFSQSLAAVSLFSSNFLFWIESGYFDAAAELKPLLHTWSLAVEEQFYVLFPLLLLAAWRFGKQFIAIVLVAVSIGSLALAQWGALNWPDATFYLLPMRAWELAIGSLIAFHLSKTRTVSASAAVKESLSLVGLAMIGYSALAFSGDTPFPSVYALVPTTGTALILIFAWPQTLVGRVLGSNLLVIIGLLSYSAYLWHQPLFAFARHKLLVNPSAALTAGLCILTFALSALSWRFVEQPFRRSEFISRRNIFLLSSISSLIFLSFGALGHATDGYLKLRTNEAQQMALRTAIPSPKRKECHAGRTNYTRPKDACTYQVKKPTWAVFGDSHAVELAYAFGEELRMRDDGVLHLSFSDCVPRYRETPSHNSCESWTNEVLDLISSDSSIKNVVVSYRIHAALFGRHEEHYPNIPRELSDYERNRRWNAYISIMNALREAQKNVFLILQAPELPTSVENLIVRDKNPSTIVGVTRGWWEVRTQFVTERLYEVPDGVQVIDPSSLFCDDDNCYAVMNGTAMYFDDDHLSVEGAKAIARKVLSN